MAVREGDVGRTAAKRQLGYLIERYGRVCQYCFNTIPAGMATRDHIVRLADGGTSDIENLTLACKQCNLNKDKNADVPRIISEQIRRTIARQARGERIVGSDPRDRDRICDTWGVIIQVGISGTIRRQVLGAKLVAAAPGDIMFSSLYAKKKKIKDYTIASS